MGTMLDRRAVLGGTVAAALIPSTLTGGFARATTLAERQMRRKLCERLMRRRLAMKAAYRLDDVCEEILAEADHRIAWIELTEFDLDEGPWRALTKEYPLGIPHGVLGEARVRDRLECDVRWTSQETTEKPGSAKARARHEDALAALAEFERGEGKGWDEVEAHPNDV